MGRPEDELPQIEVVDGADDAVRTEVEVTIAPKSSRAGWLVGAVVIVIALLATAVVVNRDGGADAEDEAAPASSTTERTTTTRPTTTTTTTTDGGAAGDSGATDEYLTGSPGPVFGESVNASLLLGGNGGGRWHLVNLDTGRIVELGGLADLDGWCLIPVRDGVVSHCNDHVQHITIPTTAPGTVPELAPNDQLELPRRDLRDSDLDGDHYVVGILPTGRTDRLWLITSPPYDLRVGPDHYRATMIDLDGTPHSISQPLPHRPDAASSLGLIVNLGGRSYLIDEHGSTDLGPGTIHAAHDTNAARFACDPEMTCRQEIIDLTTGEVTAHSEVPTDVAAHPHIMVQAADGSIATVTNPEPNLEPSGSWQATLHVTRPDGRSLRTRIDDLRITGSGAYASIQWLPDDLGLLAIGQHELTRILEHDGELRIQSVAERPRPRGSNGLIVPHGPQTASE